jgi:phosphatidate phosphatase APP1
MKKFILATFLLLSTQLFARTLIVVDIDDTIKVTNVLSKPDIYINALLSKKAFAGMSELLQEMNISETSIVYVSGSPSFLTGRIDAFLSFNHFPQPQNVVLRDDLSIKTYDYKIDRITKLLSRNVFDKVILVGDDTEYDPEIYHEISKRFKVDSIYIHAILDRALPNSDILKNYFSSVEVAGFEMLKSNLKNSNSLARVVSAFVNQNNSSLVVIPGRYCPRQGREELEELRQKTSAQSSIELFEKAQEKIISTCSRY